MSDGVTQETLDIFAKRVLAKAELLQKQEVFQENYNGATPLGTKAPLLLYIINNGADEHEGANTDFGSPVRCLKLCKRILLEDPDNTIVCTQKSKVTMRFELVLIVEFENGAFEVLTLPQDLSSSQHYVAATTKAFVNSTVINASGVPVIQHQNIVQPYETLVIETTGVNQYTDFKYMVNIPLSSFSAELRPCELNDPTLQSFIVLRNLNYEVDVLDQFQVLTGATTSIWTTMVDFSLYEDIIDKLGIEQDIQIVGTPEYVCTDTSGCM